MPFTACRYHSWFSSSLGGGGGYPCPPAVRGLKSLLWVKAHQSHQHFSPRLSQQRLHHLKLQGLESLVGREASFTKNKSPAAIIFRSTIIFHVSWWMPPSVLRTKKIIAAGELFLVKLASELKSLPRQYFVNDRGHPRPTCSHDSLTFVSRVPICRPTIPRPAILGDIRFVYRRVPE